MICSRSNANNGRRWACVVVMLSATSCSCGGAGDGEGDGDGDGDPQDCERLYVDADGDGFGGGATRTVCSGDDRAGLVDGTGDCDDDDDHAYPGAAELEHPTQCARDDDDDGFASDGAAPPGGLVGTDCDDDDDATFPGAAANDDAPAVLAEPGACATDDDGDGYASPIAPPRGIAGSDCDDADAAAFPGAAPNDDAGGAAVCRRDVDGDDWGDVSALAPVEAGTDCDDAVAATFAGAPELDDGLDNDCDGEALHLVRFDRDLDGSTPGYGSASGPGPDCDDDDALVHPGMPELPDDAIDNDCAGGDSAANDDGGLYVDGADAACDDAVATRATPACTIAGAQVIAGGQQPAPPIFVAAGTYAEAIDATTSIFGGYDVAGGSWTRAAGFATRTIVEGAQRNEAITVTAPGVALEGFTVHTTPQQRLSLRTIDVEAPDVVLAHLVVRGGATESFSHAIDCENADGCLIASNEIVVQNGATSGTATGVHASGGSVRVLDNVVTAGIGAPNDLVGIDASGNFAGVTTYVARNRVTGAPDGTTIRNAAALQVGVGDVVVMNNVLDAGDATNDANGINATPSVGDATTSVVIVGNFVRQDRTQVSQLRALIAHNVFVAHAGGSFVGLDIGNAEMFVANNVIDGRGAASSRAFTWNGTLEAHAHDNALTVDETFPGQADVSFLNDCGFRCVEAGGNFAPADPLIDPDGRPLVGSPLVDAGGDLRALYGVELAPFDADGDLRPQDGDGDGAARPDVGFDERPAP